MSKKEERKGNEKIENARREALCGRTAINIKHILEGRCPKIFWLTCKSDATIKTSNLQRLRHMLKITHLDKCIDCVQLLVSLCRNRCRVLKNNM